MNKTVKTPHIQTQRNLIRECEFQVMALLGWTHGEYCIHQFGEYCAFAEAFACDWGGMRNRMLYSPVFRGFWNALWAERNLAEFLAFAPECGDHAHNYREYLFIHSHERLLEDGAFISRLSHIIRLL